MSILVDTNIHVIALPEQRTKYPLNIFPGTESEFTEEQSNDPNDFVKTMESSGLQQAYLMASRFHGFDNNYCADAMGRYPQQFVGVANIDITAPDVTKKITYWIQERGLHGVRFWGGGPVAGHRFPGDTRGRADYVDEPKYQAAFDCVRELGVPANAQATMPEVMANTRRMLERNPGIRWTFNNLVHVPAKEGAGSEAAQGLLAMAEFPGTYVNFSANFMGQTMENPAAKELLDALIERFGSRRLIWSSFGRKIKDAVEIMKKGVAHLPQQDQDNILGEGARDLYPALRKNLPSKRPQ